MNDELPALTERQVLGWPGVSKETTGAVGAGTDLGVTGDSLKRVGRRAFRHIYDTGVAEFVLAEWIHDELISDGRAEPHVAGFAGVAGYRIRELEHLPRAVKLFRMNRGDYGGVRAAAGDPDLVDPRIAM